MYCNTGMARHALDFVLAFEKECQRLGVEPCGRSRLDAMRRSESPLRHALTTGGFRAYHAVRPSTDPRTRALSPLGYGQVLHIDSSDLDVRFAPDLIRHFAAAKAKFYIGIDGATGDTMAHSLIFGPARTDGLALLIREYVRRHGFLPRMIHVDRGSENTSRWLAEFCAGRIHLRHSPTAASAWNGIAENAIKQINEQVAHKQIGSTAPDQKGRKVDGRFKSRNNAQTAFTTILQEFITFAYQDLPNTPRGDGRIPAKEKDRCLDMYGIMGVPCVWNDDFLIQTSIRIQRWKKPDVQRGVRTAEGWFVSPELVEALRHGQAEEVRSDCCYPEVVYVRVAGRWIKVFHNRVQSIAVLSDTEKLFHLLSGPIVRSDSRPRRDEIARTRHSRQKLAEAARDAVCHLAPTPEQEEQLLTHDVCPPPQNVEGLELIPFEEREDY
jgi:putative transposase